MTTENTETTRRSVEPIKPDRGEDPPTDTGRFSAFRTDYGRYVGGVHDSEAKAKKAARDAGVSSDAITIVQV